MWYDIDWRRKGPQVLRCLVLVVVVCVQRHEFSSDTFLHIKFCTAERNVAFWKRDKI